MLQNIKKGTTMKKIFVPISLFLITLSLQASDYDCKQNSTPLTTPRTKQKGLTPIPKLMTVIVQLHKEVESADFTKQDPSFISSLISKDELLSILATAKSTFPKLALSPNTADYMLRAEKIVTDLDGLVKVKGSLIDALKVLIAMNGLADDLPKFIHANLDQTGEVPTFLQLLFAPGLPDDEQGQAAKAEIMKNLSKETPKTEKEPRVLPQKSRCVIL